LKTRGVECAGLVAALFGRKGLPAFLLLSLAFSGLTAHPARAQASAEPTKGLQDLFQLETRPVAGGAELITISARLNGIRQNSSSSDLNSSQSAWVPLVSVLRDTMGDANPDNDRLRYLWALSYTRPSARQRAASAIPFFYTRVGNKDHATKEPPAIMDLGAADHEVWQSIFWQALQTILLDTYGAPLRAATRQYRENIGDYRKSHIIRALSVLSLYQSLKGEKVFSDEELQEIQARLYLTDKTFGGIVDDQNLRGVYQKESSGIEDKRGHNWELLRQQAEHSGLYFEPLAMPDGSATHAMLWIDRKELHTQSAGSFAGRFLNIADPWNDDRIATWNGYTETRYLDSENRPVAAETPGARAIELIPLALYGLDNRKIPLLLVDFRDTLNPKRREMSRRVLQDVTKDVLAISQFGNLPYFVGRSIFDFVTGRRGVDINQPSRLRSYAQLKMLLSLDASLSPQLHAEVNKLLEKVSLNPAENDLETEARLAQEQYRALLEYADRPNGLPARLDRDRRTELVALEHGPKARFAFKLANILTFGKYVHREDPSPELLPRLDLARSLAYHTRLIREVSRSSPQVEVSWDLQEIRRSLRFIAEHGGQADARAAAAIAQLFSRTGDEETRRICLDSLSRINNERARVVLTNISQNSKIDQSWRELSAQYLEKTARMEMSGKSGGSDKAVTSGIQQ
jgi:hypothetical protein